MQLSMHIVPPILAESGMASVVFWSLVLIALLLGGYFTVMWLRRTLKEEDDAPSPIGFTLSDLRQLHREGKMTDEEFERARGKMVAAAKEMAAKLPDPLARERRPPPPRP